MDYEVEGVRSSHKNNRLKLWQNNYQNRQTIQGRCCLQQEMENFLMLQNGHKDSV